MLLSLVKNQAEGGRNGVWAEIALGSPWRPGLVNTGAGPYWGQLAPVNLCVALPEPDDSSASMCQVPVVTGCQKQPRAPRGRLLGCP